MIRLACSITHFLVIFITVYVVNGKEVPPHIYRDAEFAVAELRQLSDSGIYTSLSLASILDFEEIDGVYHDNVALELELRSEHFKSKQNTEIFNMVVMKHKKEDITTLAIDEFPVMDDDAIEQYYIRKVEENRENREKAFERLYRQSLSAEAPSLSTTPSPFGSNSQTNSSPQLSSTNPTSNAFASKSNPSYSAKAATPTLAKNDVKVSADGKTTTAESGKKSDDPREIQSMSLQELHALLANSKVSPSIKKEIQFEIKRRYGKKK
eukprot:gene26598-32146_t